MLIARPIRSIRMLLVALIMLAAPAASFGQVAVSIITHPLGCPFMSSLFVPARVISGRLDIGPGATTTTTGSPAQVLVAEVGFF